MIPRVKVNYGLGSLIAALRASMSDIDTRGNLEAELQSLFGTPHVLLTPSGRAGLYFILRAIEKSRVLVPAYTCKAVVEAALMAGKEVVYVKSEADGFNMDANDVAANADENCVIVATHQFGIPCDIARIMEIARSCGALVIEDAAASFGSRINGRLTGTFSDAAFFSFDSTKTVNVPLKGGFILTAQLDLHERIKRIYREDIHPMPPMIAMKCFLSGLAYLLLKNHLIYRVFHLLNFDLRGRFTAESQEMDLSLSMFYSYDMSHWQAYLAWDQIKKREVIFKFRRDQFAAYRQRLKGCDSFLLPPEDRNGEWVCTRFPIRVLHHKMDFYKATARYGVDMAFSFTFIAASQNFVYEHRVAGQVLDLPYYLKLTPAERDKVVSICRRVDCERER
jgi:dTDP-4-amino-4,6-dideoxygalactose transaminase